MIFELLELRDMAQHDIQGDQRRDCIRKCLGIHKPCYLKRQMQRIDPQQDSANTYHQQAVEYRKYTIGKILLQARNIGAQIKYKRY